MLAKMGLRAIAVAVFGFVFISFDAMNFTTNAVTLLIKIMLCSNLPCI